MRYARLLTAVFLQVTGYRLLAAVQTPTPALSQGRETLSDAEPQAAGVPSATNYRPRTTSHEPQLQATSYRPQATGHMLPFSDSPDEAGPAAEIRGPCRTNHQDSVAAALPTTSYPLRAVPSPSPRTTNHEPTGRTHGSVPTTRKPRATSHDHKPQATGYMPPFRHSSQASLWLARVGTLTGAVSVARGDFGTQ